MQGYHAFPHHSARYESHQVHQSKSYCQPMLEHFTCAEVAIVEVECGASIAGVALPRVSTHEVLRT